MAKVTNNHSSALRLGETEVPAKGSAEVRDWNSLRNNGVISRWLESGILSVSDAGEDSGYEAGQGSADEPEPEQEDTEVVEGVQFTEAAPAIEEAHDFAPEESDDVTAQKATLIAQLKELDVKADKRSSVEKLQEKLDEALAK